MSNKEVIISGLRKTHYQHLLDVLVHARQNDIYWGRKDYWDKRQCDLEIVVENIINYLGDEVEA